MKYVTAIERMAEERGKEQGIQIGEKRGEKRGEKKMQQAIAIKLLEQGFEVEAIVELTGLTLKQVQQLQTQPES